MAHGDRPLFHLCLHLGRLLEARLSAELAPLNIGQGQARVLVDLDDHGPSRAAAMAQRLAVSAPTMTLLVRAVEQAGLVRRRADPEHARAAQVRLTARGTTVVVHIRAIWNRVEGDLRAGATTAHVERHRRSLHALHTALGGAIPSENTS